MRATAVPDARVARRRAARRSRSSSTSRSTTASARSSRSSRRAGRGSGRGSATTRHGSFPEIAAALERVGARAQGAAGARRRDRRARRARASRPASSSCRAAFICRACDPRIASRDRRPARLGRVHRVRPPARRARPTCATGRSSSGARRSSGCSDAPDRRSSASAIRCAATAARSTQQALDRGWEGLIAKHARLALQVRQADARLAQAEDRPRAGVRRRRLDRAAADARRTSARCCSASTSPRAPLPGRWSTPGTSAPASTRRSSRA